MTSSLSCGTGVGFSLGASGVGVGTGASVRGGGCLRPDCASAAPHNRHASSKQPNNAMDGFVLFITQLDQATHVYVIAKACSRFARERFAAAVAEACGGVALLRAA